MARLMERDTLLALQDEVFSLYSGTADKIHALLPTPQLLMRVFILKEVNSFADVLLVLLMNDE